MAEKRKREEEEIKEMPMPKKVFRERVKDLAITMRNKWREGVNSALKKRQLEDEKKFKMMKENIEHKLAEGIMNLNRKIEDGEFVETKLTTINYWDKPNYGVNDENTKMEIGPYVTLEYPIGEFKEYLQEYQEQVHMLPDFLVKSNYESQEILLFLIIK